MDAPDGSVREDLDADQPPVAGNGHGFYRLGRNQSSASVFEDVEMAHDEVSCRCCARCPRCFA
jgi:cation-transporting ATPase 13A3/4/5